MVRISPCRLLPCKRAKHAFLRLVPEAGHFRDSTQCCDSRCGCLYRFEQYWQSFEGVIDVSRALSHSNLQLDGFRFEAAFDGYNKMGYSFGCRWLCRIYCISCMQERNDGRMPRLREFPEGKLQFLSLLRFGAESILSRLRGCSFRGPVLPRMWSIAHLSFLPAVAAISREYLTPFIEEISSANARTESGVPLKTLASRQFS